MQEDALDGNCSGVRCTHTHTHEPGDTASVVDAQPRATTQEVKP
jgi:hypothetical protein